MTAPVKTWASLPASAAADAAMRVAAAGVCGFPKVASGWNRYGGVAYAYLLASGDVRKESDWLHSWNRDDLARVFAAARTANPGLPVVWVWCGYSLDDPRAALCALLDLLSVPVLQELHQ